MTTWWGWRCADGVGGDASGMLVEALGGNSQSGFQDRCEKTRVDAQRVELWFGIVFKLLDPWLSGD